MNPRTRSMQWIKLVEALTARPCSQSMHFRISRKSHLRSNRPILILPSEEQLLVRTMTETPSNWTVTPQVAYLW